MLLKIKLTSRTLNSQFFKVLQKAKHRHHGCLMSLFLNWISRKSAVHTIFSFKTHIQTIRIGLILMPEAPNVRKYRGRSPGGRNQDFQRQRHADQFMTFSISTSTLSSELFFQMTDATEEERELDGMLLISKFIISNFSLLSARIVSLPTLPCPLTICPELETPKQLQNVYWLH